MAILSLQWAGRPRPLLVAVLVPTLAVACAGDGVPQYREEPVALQVEEDWDLLVEQPTDSFLDTVGRNAESFADTGAKSTAVVGCIAGGVTLVVMTEGQLDAAGELGCMAGGLVLYPVGYALGYGTGAVVGTVQGAINAFSTSSE